MKKVILAIFVSIAGMAGFSSCSDDDEAPVLGAYVEVTVKDIVGNPYKEGTVYMFKNVDPNEETDKGSADKTEKTDENGVAKFKLNFTELNITESKTPLFFAVYYTGADGDIVVKAGEGSVTVKRDDEKKLTITIPVSIVTE
jgi:hypothetical protein